MLTNPMPVRSKQFMLSRTFSDTEKTFFTRFSSDNAVILKDGLSFTYTDILSDDESRFPLTKTLTSYFPTD